jgi:hypothetical protein
MLRNAVVISLLALLPTWTTSCIVLQNLVAVRDLLCFLQSQGKCTESLHSVLHIPHPLRSFLTTLSLGCMQAEGGRSGGCVAARDGGKEERAWQHYLCYSHHISIQ